jgi:hypothetical protein
MMPTEPISSDTLDDVELTLGLSDKERIIRAAMLLSDQRVRGVNLTAKEVLGLISAREKALARLREERKRHEC